VDHGLPELASALQAFTAMPTVWVGANPDPGADEVRKAIRGHQTQYWQIHENLPPEVYLSALFYAACLIGNSSSGFHEAPYFGTQVINVGDRQRGRSPEPDCVMNVRASFLKIMELLEQVRRDPGHKYPVERPYSDGEAARRIAKILTEHEGETMRRKQFNDGP
jgi:UDP-N-acetylglucosamine 2-epimerase